MAGKDVLPRARQDGLVIRELADETLVYDLERHKAHCLNQTAALIWNHCDGRTSVAEIARSLGAEFNSPVDEDLTWFAIRELKKAKLLQEPLTGTRGVHLSRREAMRKLGAAAAVTLPFVVSIVAPRAAAAASCGANGAGCTGSGQGNCCTGLLCCANKGNTCHTSC